MKHILAVLSLTLVSSVALAETPSYNMIGFGGGVMDVDWHEEEDMKGWMVGGSVELTDSIFISGKYEKAKIDIYDTEASSIGFNAGYFSEYGTDSTWHTSLGLGRIDVENDFTDEDEMFLSWEAGVRKNVTETIELNGGMRTTYLEETGTATGLYVGTLISVGEGFGINLGLAFNPGNNTGILAGICYTF